MGPRDLGAKEWTLTAQTEPSKAARKTGFPTKEVIFCFASQAFAPLSWPDPLFYLLRGRKNWKGVGLMEGQGGGNRNCSKQERTTPQETTAGQKERKGCRASIEGGPVCRCVADRCALEWSCVTGRRQTSGLEVLKQTSVSATPVLGSAVSPGDRTQSSALSSRH